MTIVRRTFLIFGLILPLAACAVPASRDGVVPDPYEVQNRRVHEFNRSVDRALFRPAARGYGFLVPTPVREGIGNFSDNASTPAWFVNNLLQGQIENAGHNLFRFTLNSTLGVAGIFDPASSFGLERRAADFGQTLHVWGTGSGAYLELPLVGPSTQRDTVGLAVDLVTNPVRVLASEEVNAVVFASRVADAFNDRAAFRESYDQILYESADSYAQTREIFIQNRRFELEGGETEEYFDPYDGILE